MPWIEVQVSAGTPLGCHACLAFATRARRARNWCSMIIRWSVPGCPRCQEFAAHSFEYETHRAALPPLPHPLCAISPTRIQRKHPNRRRACQTHFVQQNISKPMHTHRHIHRHTHRHAHGYTRTHTHTHTHTHTPEHQHSPWSTGPHPRSTGIHPPPSIGTHPRSTGTHTHT